MSLREKLSDYWFAFQQELFPRLEERSRPDGRALRAFRRGPGAGARRGTASLLPRPVGRPEEDRAALARAFIAKAVFALPTTRALIEVLRFDARLRRLCGWSGAGRLPSEATFSRAFSEFAKSRLQETLVARTMDGHLVEHISRDATAIKARQKPKRRCKRGRPRKEEERSTEPSRLERQLTMTLPQKVRGCVAVFRPFGCSDWARLLRNGY